MRKLWGTLALMFVVGCAAPGANRTVPLKPSDVVGSWIGYSENYLDFYRITLDPDGTGLCVGLYLMELSSVYRIKKWTLQSDGSVPLELVPNGGGAEPIRVDAALRWDYLRLAVMGRSGWTNQAVLYREKRFLDRVNLSAEIARDPTRWNVNQQIALPASPRQWQLFVWVAKSGTIFWVKLDETGAGSYWASDRNCETSEGKIKSTEVVSRQLYDSILSCSKNCRPKDVPTASEEQEEKTPCEDPSYLVTLDVLVGEQQRSSHIPPLKSLDECAGLRPIVEECAGMLPEDTRKGIER